MLLIIFAVLYKFRQMLLQREEFDLRHDTVRKRLDRRVLGAWWRPVVLVRDSSWTILGSTCFDRKIWRLTLLLQALCKRSVVTFVGYALLRVGRTPLRKTPVGLTADLFTDPSFDQQPWEAVSHFHFVFPLWYCSLRTLQHFASLGGLLPNFSLNVVLDIRRNLFSLTCKCIDIVVSLHSDSFPAPYFIEAVFVVRLVAWRSGPAFSVKLNSKHDVVLGPSVLSAFHHCFSHMVPVDVVSMISDHLWKRPYSVVLVFEATDGSITEIRPWKASDTRVIFSVRSAWNKAVLSPVKATLHIIRCSTNIMLMKLPPQLRHGYSTLHLKQGIELHVMLVGGFLLVLTLHWSSGTLLHVPLANVCRHSTWRFLLPPPQGTEHYRG